MKYYRYKVVTRKLSKKRLAQARRVSAAVFGAQHRLPAALIVASAPQDEIYAAVVAKCGSMTDAQASTELQVLCKADLLEKREAERKAGQRGRTPILYGRRESAFWALAMALVDDPPLRPAE
jgi:hypothetical protein